jgi:hypothetical protein
LSIYLPTGSEPGKYQVEIVEQPGKALISAESAAALRDHIAVLEVNVDLQRLHPGLYPGQHTSGRLELGVLSCGPKVDPSSIAEDSWWQWVDLL